MAFAGAALGLLLSPAPGRADDASDDEKASQPGAEAEETAHPSIATLPLFAGGAALRNLLAGKGITFQLTYIGDALANVAGGMRRGAVYNGRLELDVDADLGKLAGLRGASVHVSGFDYHGTGGLSRDFIGNLMEASGVEALPSVRLYEAWFEQKFADGKIAVRAGQLAADTEFLTSDYAELFVNSTFGWPAITEADLPSGGPAEPLAAPGVRLKLRPTEKTALLVGLFDGNSAGPGPGDPEELDPHGVNFRVTDPPFIIGEGQYSYSLAADLPGTAKLGAWGHLGQFKDLRFDTLGLSLADPASTGTPRILQGDSGIYGVLDQRIYRLPGGEGNKGIGIFIRASASPSDRDLIDFYADAGVNFAGVLPNRPDDTFGIAAAYAHISDRAAALDRDRNFFTGLAAPVRDYEAAIEATYQAQIVPGWTVQPDFQYIFHPGGHVANPKIAGAATPIGNAVVVGLRTTVTY